MFFLSNGSQGPPTRLSPETSGQGVSWVEKGRLWVWRQKSKRKVQRPQAYHSMPQGARSPEGWNPKVLGARCPVGSARAEPGMGSAGGSASFRCQPPRGCEEGTCGMDGGDQVGIPGVHSEAGGRAHTHLSQAGRGQRWM